MYEILSKMTVAPYLFHTPKEEQDKIKLNLIKKSMAYHYDNNEYYRNLCEASNISPSEISEIDDLIRIPLIPIRFFKQPDPDARYLLSVPMEKIEFEIRSSGTGGVPSIARRDYDTVTNVILFYIALYRDFFKIVDGAGLYLCPSPEEMPHMGMIKTFNIINYALNTSGYAVENMRLDSEKALNFLQKWEGKFTRHILGPPFLLNSFLDYLKEKEIRLKLDKDTKIVTVGGWKHHTGSQIPRKELDQKCIDYLGIEKSQIRDMYGMVESNMLAIECENNLKHVPPTVHFSIRDVDDPTKEVKDGEEGLVAILDPSSLSYPAFLLTEDMGIMRRHVKCACGRTGDLIDVIGRAPKSDYKTCALTLGQYMDEKDKPAVNA